MRNEQRVWSQIVEKRQCGAVFNTLDDGVFVQVALVILAAESLKGSPPVGGLVDRRAGKTNVGCLRESSHEVVAKIAPRRPMGLVHQDVDVAPFVDLCRHAMKLLDRRYNDPAVIAF